MKIWVYTITHNEAEILPFFLRHYGSFCDRITVFDDNSTDGTQAIVQAFPKTVLEKYPYGSGLDDRDFIRFARETYPNARGHADWVIWVDPDELLYHPQLVNKLEELLKSGVQVPNTRGFQMVSDEFPAYRDRQIWEQIDQGIEDPTYAKPCIFRPECEMQWDPGKHYVHGNFNRGGNTDLKLLHYRYLGLDYLMRRHARNYSRCSKANLEAGLGVGVYPQFEGHMSAKWFAEKLPQRRPVLETSTFHELVRVVHGGKNPYLGAIWYKPEPMFQPTWGSEDPWFHELLDQLRPQVIIEVGTFLGRSAIHMGSRLKELGLDSAIICVDTWLGDEIHWTLPEVRPLLMHEFGRPEFYKAFLGNVVHKRLDKTIVPLPMDSMSAARLLAKLGIHADFIYIDGGHAEGEVYRDLENYWNRLRKGGAMLVDDYMPGEPMFEGIVKDVDRFNCAVGNSERRGVKVLFRKL